jgi:predicted nuclease of predicted toxin-antitoxin system
MMNWLLDVNVNRKLIPLLKSSGVEAHSAIDLGWRLLTNGNLIETAVANGFNVMLTNDVRIEHSAEKSLLKYPDFALVLLRLPQIPSEQIPSVVPSKLIYDTDLSYWRPVSYLALLHSIIQLLICRVTLNFALLHHGRNVVKKYYPKV